MNDDEKICSNSYVSPYIVYTATELKRQFLIIVARYLASKTLFNATRSSLWSSLLLLLLFSQLLYSVWCRLQEKATRPFGKWHSYIYTIYIYIYEPVITLIIVARPPFPCVCVCVSDAHHQRWSFFFYSYITPANFFFSLFAKADDKNFYVYYDDKFMQQRFTCKKRTHLFFFFIFLSKIIYRH